MKLLLKLSTLAIVPVLMISTPASARSHQDNHGHKPPVTTPTPPTGTTTIKSITFYGWPDNSPPGPAIAYPGLHKQAGGTGTFADPVTFATAPKEFVPGTKLYVPYLSKYVIMEDSCADCTSDWNKGVTHIDIWMNSNANFKKQVLACEDKYTENNMTVIVNPPSNETVNATPLFNTSTGKCL